MRQRAPITTMQFRLKPDYAQAYHNRGLIHAKQGKPTQAMHDYDEAIRLAPESDESAMTYYLRGNLYGEQGNLASAIADYDVVIRFLPDFADAFYNRAPFVTPARQF
jgi:tetratricopeptide (TPR) repeat protein